MEKEEINKVNADKAIVAKEAATEVTVASTSESANNPGVTAAVASAPSEPTTSALQQGNPDGTARESEEAPARKTSFFSTFTEKKETLIKLLSASKMGRFWEHRTKVQKELLLIVALPTVLAGAYVACWHSDMYESTTKFAVRSSNEVSLGSDIMSQFLNTGNASVQNARVVEQYIKTKDAFDQIDRDLHLIPHYSDKSKDIVSRLSDAATRREKEDFWNRVTSVSLNSDSGILTFKVRAYSPEMARNIAKAVLVKSEDLVNAMNLRSHEDALKLAKNEVLVAEKKVTASQDAMKDFRERHQDVDLKSTVTGLQTLVLELEGNRANLQAKLSEAKSYMKPETATVQGLEKRLAAVTQQLATEKKRLTDLKSDGSINKSVSEYEQLVLDQEFAQKQLVSAMKALETARIQLLSKSSYLVPIEQPTLPDESEYPRALLFIFCLALGLLMVYGLMSLVIASVKEHIGFR